MKIGIRLLVALIAIGGTVALFTMLVRGTNVALLNPHGSIAAQQRDLLFFACLLSLIVIVPVFVMTAFIAYRYRATNTKAKYMPNWADNKTAETIWWGVPIMLIAILAAITFASSHLLDPYRPLQSEKKPVKIQVVALDWKWLFIYPEKNIATVNYIKFPEKTPVNFEITSDAPMNSFWIPQLGGQIYAMAGMSTKLHLTADRLGTYDGLSANLSGDGFSGMKFKAMSVTDEAFDDWVNEVKNSDSILEMRTYNELAKPSKNNPKKSYVLLENNLYDSIIMKYMKPAEDKEDS